MQTSPKIKEALDDFIDEVTNGTFPGPEHSFGGGDELLEELKTENQ